MPFRLRRPRRTVYEVTLDRDCHACGQPAAGWLCTNPAQHDDADQHTSRCQPVCDRCASAHPGSRPASPARTRPRRPNRQGRWRSL